MKVQKRSVRAYQARLRGLDKATQVAFATASRAVYGDGDPIERHARFIAMSQPD